jgi:hypothetical protein
VKAYERKNSVGEKLKRAALIGVLGSIAVVGLAACGGTVATTVPATATLAPPTATPSVASATSVPTALPTLTATAQAATATMEVMVTGMPTDEPMAMGTPTTEDMIMEADPTSSQPAATAPEATATTAASQNAGDSAVSAVLKEWALDLSVSEVAAGKVTFMVTNQGTMGHNLTVVDRSGSVIGATATFRKSEGAQTLDVTLAPGTYTVLCSLPGHAALGQQAQLVVK